MERPKTNYWNAANISSGILSERLSSENVNTLLRKRSLRMLAAFGQRARTIGHLKTASGKPNVMDVPEYGHVAVKSNRYAK